jgi:hypothetical protein
MSHRFHVVFGRKQAAAAVLQRLDARRQGGAPADTLTLEPGATPALRLGSDDGARFPPAFLADLPDTVRKLQHLEADIARDFDVFAKNPRRLLDLYFDFIAARPDAEADALERRLRPLGGLFRVEDWAFSALRPLPNAAVFDADAPDATSAVVLHDLAFWTGETVLTVRLRGSGTPSPHETETCARLQALGVSIVTIPVQELAAGVAIFSPSRFPAEFLFFWQDAAYPCSPFRPQGLTRSLSLD